MTAGPILVTGGSGQVGIELRRRAGRVVAPDRSQLDLANPEAIAAVVASRPWSAVINAAAYTAVDQAESDVAAAWRINAVGPAVLAAETARLGIPLVHVSTDYVFGGTKDGAYLPDDPTAPLGVYGASKLAGEIAIRSANPRHAIVRTAWVISPHGANFAKTMVRLAGERDHLRIVSDQLGCPTSAGDLADALILITNRLADSETAGGTWHFVNRGDASWDVLARAIFADLARRGRPSPTVEPISTADYPTPARRPANSRLSTASSERDFGIVPRHWQDALDDILSELLDHPSPLPKEHA